MQATAKHERIKKKIWNHPDYIQVVTSYENFSWLFSFNLKSRKVPAFFIHQKSTRSIHNWLKRREPVHHGC